MENNWVTFRDIIKDIFIRQLYILRIYWDILLKEDAHFEIVLIGMDRIFNAVNIIFFKNSDSDYIDDIKYKFLTNDYSYDI